MDSKISQLTELTLPAIEDLLPIVDISASLTKKITLATLDARWALKAGLAGGQTIKGGTGVTDILKLQGTSGNGTLTSPAIQALVGNNGATTALTILNNGNVGIGTTGPLSTLNIIGDVRISGYDKQLIFNNQSGVSTWKTAAISSIDEGANYKGALTFLTHPDDGGSATNLTERMRINSSGNVGIGTTGPTISGTGKLDMNADTFRLRTARTPASAGAAGNAGEICWDASYIYVCVATNTWVRAAIATW